MTRKPAASQQAAPPPTPRETAIAFWRRTKAQQRLQEALNHVQRAQDELGLACAALSSLRFGAPTWRLANRLYDQVHAGWYKISDRRGDKRLEMDREPTPEELAVVIAPQGTQ